MNIIETDPEMIKRIREKDLGAILHWFEQRKNSLYKLAYVYIKNNSTIQDVFYNVIMTVHSEAKKQKRNPNIESWMFSLFFQECKQQRHHAYSQTIFVQLDEIYKDAVVLTYVAGQSIEKVADILEIPNETVLQHMHKGIQRLIGGEDSHYQDKFLSYLNRTIARTDKIELEIHLHTCQRCQSGLAAFQDTINILYDEAQSINIPTDFLNVVVNRINKVEEIKRKKSKKQKRIGIAFTSMIAVFMIIGFVTNGFAYAYYTWLGLQGKEDEALLNYLKSGLGEPLNLVQENNGIRVTIKSAIADEFQTLIYYEVENLNNDDQYAINVWDGVIIPDEVTTLNQTTYPINQLPIQPLKSEGNIFKGTISLLPILDETKTIKLNISKLQKMDEDFENALWMYYYGTEGYIHGKWDFEIPIEKKSSIVHEVDKVITVDGIPIQFDSFIIAPTVTVLHFRPEVTSDEISLNEVYFKGIKTEEKITKPLLFGYSFPIHSLEGGYNGYHAVFNTMYFEKPKEVDVLLNSLSYFTSDNYKVDIDMNKPFPQTFDYMGSNISIEKVILGQPTKIEMKMELNEGRKFESLSLEFLDQHELTPTSMGVMEIDGTFMDRNGKKLDLDEHTYYSLMQEQNIPRQYQTKMTIEVLNDNLLEEFIPSKLQIQGNQRTTYLDEVIKFHLN